MQKPLSGQIHLSYQRGYTETGILQRYCSFNYGTYFNEHRKPLGCLRVFNEEVLAGGEATFFQPGKPGYAVFIPIIGELVLQGDNQGSQVIDIAKAYVQHAFPGEVLTLVNRYPDDPINYLYFFVDSSDAAFIDSRIFDFDLAGKPNELIGADHNQRSLPFRLRMGMFAGRADALCRLKDSNSLFYAFVIAGAFEVQGRLLHQRDGLALWGGSEIDIEALSNNAVIITLELL
ncbi:hypothetical protein LX99_00525 [Mucilaginibacter oryzae]|uniref:Quercetin 2,3-dioxygenase C-terminal cupin domain-containing protein n=1 Tax=Mucilaginibacter oryzae TaxID=468058 RepID=A0A316HJ54_9SPHI|nr:hypothetical protein [Mucilaginibacter oryzae]PWK80061.1 hypothetical protein LX99_00525 [Mucilaginibacter oryzae]